MQKHPDKANPVLRNFYYFGGQPYVVIPVTGTLRLIRLTPEAIGGAALKATLNGIALPKLPMAEPITIYMGEYLAFIADSPGETLISTR